MRTAEMIEQEGRDLAGWLIAHSDDFPPLQIIRVDSRSEIDSGGEAIVRLTAVLADPVDPEAGWPIDGIFALYQAVNDLALDTDHQVLAYLHLQSRSDGAA